MPSKEATWSIKALDQSSNDHELPPKYQLFLSDNKTEFIYDEIEGLSLKPGSFATIKVKITPRPNPPQGASSLRYELLEVIK